MTTPHQAWVGCHESAQDVLGRHQMVAEATAAALRVPLAEIVVEEIPADNGLLLVAHYWPELGLS